MTELSGLMARLTDVVYDLGEGRDERAREKWERDGYRRMDVEEEVGIQPMGGKTWYATFTKKGASGRCRYSAAPPFVIAVRGTSLRSFHDLQSDLMVLLQCLHEDERYKHLQLVADKLVDVHGYRNVWITGHSLGAARALLVAKDLVVRGMPVETYLYNPPFQSSTAWLHSQKQRMVEVGCRAIFTGIQMVAYACQPDDEGGQKLMAMAQHSKLTEKLTPNLFINRGDVVSNGYLKSLKDRTLLGGTGVTRFVSRFSLLSLTSADSLPRHLLSGPVNITVAGLSKGQCLIKSHSLEQWMPGEAQLVTQKFISVTGESTSLDPGNSRQDHEFGDPWESGKRVKGVRFGRQVAQRLYVMRGEWHSESLLMRYVQTTGAHVVQAAWSMATWGIGTSKHVDVSFLFNKQRDAEIARQRWPHELSSWEINGKLLPDWCNGFELQRHKFRKGAVTFYAYAVKSCEDKFERGHDWLAFLQGIDEMENITDWVSLVRKLAIVVAVMA